MSFDLADARRPEHPTHPAFFERWSSRSFSGEAIPDDDLRTCFEAARWAPSSNNSQPVRFVYAHRGTEDFNRLLALLNERNRLWAHQASVLVFILSRTDFVQNGAVRQMANHAFDTGAAWAAFAHQAHLLGYATRAIGGFDKAAAPDVLGVPDNHAVHVAVAVGPRGTLDHLSSDFHALETPSQRRPLDSFIHQGRFNGDAA